MSCFTVCQLAELESLFASKHTWGFAALWSVSVIHRPCLLAEAYDVHVQYDRAL